MTLLLRRLFKTTEGRILFGIVVVGAALRLFALHYGLPRLYLEDEEFFVVPALRVAGGNIDPQWYGAPGHTLIYGLAVIFRIVNKVINLTNGTVFVVAENYKNHITAFQAAGRIIPALAGTLSVIPVYLIGSRWSKRAGLWAAGLTAASFYLVDQSHIIRPDILQTFFILWMIYFGIRIAERSNNLTPYILFGISFGLGVTTKYPTLFLVVPMVVFIVVLARARMFEPIKWCISGAASLIAAFISGPFLFLNFSRMMHDVAIENRASHGGQDHWNTIQNLWWYITHVLNAEIGTLLGAVAIITIIIVSALFFRRWNTPQIRLSAMLALIAVTHLLSIAFLRLHWERWMIPVLALGLIIAAIGIDVLLGLRIPRILTVFILAALLAAPAVRMMRVLFGYAHPNTVEIARDWMLNNVPDGSTIVYEPFAPEIPSDRYNSIRTDNVSWYEREYYLELGATHFVFTGGVHGVIVREAERFGPGSNFDKAVKRYNALIEAGKELYSIEPNKRYSSGQMLMSNDFSVLRTLDISLLRGPYVRIYSFEN